VTIPTNKPNIARRPDQFYKKTHAKNFPVAVAGLDQTFRPKAVHVLLATVALKQSEMLSRAPEEKKGLIQFRVLHGSFINRRRELLARAGQRCPSDSTNLRTKHVPPVEKDNQL